MRYALPFSAVSVTLSLIIAWVIGFRASVWVMCILLAITLFVAFVLRSEKRKLIALVLICSTASFGMYVARMAFDVNECLAVAGKTTEIEACVTDMPSSNTSGYSYTVKVISTEDKSLPDDFNITLYTADELEAEGYEIFRCSVEFSELNKENRIYNYADGIYLTGETVTEVVPTGKYHGTVGRFFLNIREKLIGYFSETFDSDVSGIVSGIVTGYREGMSEKDNDNFRSCGVSHIVAVSGLHVSVISAAILFLLTKLGLYRRTASIISIIGVFFFVAVIGFPLSAVRAGIMFAVFAIAFALLQEYHAVTSLAAAVLTIVIIEPFAAVSPGFLLSVCATFGILTMGTRLNELMCESLPENRILAAPLRFVYGTLSLTVASNIFVLPLSYIFFGYISVVSPISNIVAIPLAEVCFITAIFAGVFSFVPWLSFVSTPLAYISGISAKGLSAFCDALSNMTDATVDISSSFFGIWIVITLVLLAFAYLLGGERLKILVASLLSITILVTGSVLIYNRDKNSVEIVAVDTEVGCSVLIVSEKSAVIIGAPSSGYEISSALYSKGIERVEAIILPTLIKSCASGADEIILSQNVSSIYMPDQGECRSEVVCANVNNLPVKNSEDISLTFFDGVTVMCYNTYVRVTCRDVAVLITFPYYDAADDPESLRQAELLICGEVGAKGVTAKGAKNAFVIGDAEHVGYSLNALTERGIACFATGGEGSLTMRIDKNGETSLHREVG